MNITLAILAPFAALAAVLCAFLGRQSREEGE